MRVRAFHLVDERNGVVLAVKEGRGSADAAADHLARKGLEISIWGCGEQIRPGTPIDEVKQRLCLAVVRKGRKNARGYAVH
ncbi:hypothetical protein AA18890_2688 [Komagataeibacter europaeus LMG 18890]|nr:hypothetical protein AA18890_2688 [Komagataeibacter europaeus LMG 18890]